MNNEMQELYYFLKRCSDLSKYAFGNVSPNPMVGALLVYNQRIIGEGFHEFYGKPHAEVNAVNSVKKSEKFLIPDSRLFISLEPCNFYGKTPACTELIVKNNIKSIVVSNLDKTEGLNGQSLRFLNENHVETSFYAIEKPEYNPVRFRNIFTTLHRPYIVIKYAVSADGFIGNTTNRIKLSNSLSDRFVHLLRSHCDAILVGKNTVISDSPLLTTRLVPGRSPKKILIDPNLEVPFENVFYSTPGEILVYNYKESRQFNNINLIKIEPGESFLNMMMKDLYSRNVGILLVEGGSFTIEKLLETELYDEIYEIQTPKILKEGVKKPREITGLKTEHRFRDDIVLRKYVDRLQ